LLVEAGGLGASFDPVRQHALRRRLRRLRYIVEVRDLLHGRRSTALRELKAMQEQLGEMHDRWLLAEWLGARGATATAASLRTDVRRRHRAWLDQGPAERIESLSLAPAPPA
jgi:CHAD domain-containing protein